MLRSLFALVACVPSLLMAQAPPTTPVPEITTTGQAEVRLPADRVRLRFVVQSSAATAAQAATLNGDRVRRVQAALATLGFRGNDARAIGFTVAPNYEYREQRRLVDYQARTSVDVTLRQMERMGAVLDAALGAGATEIGAMQFQSDTAERARLGAIAAAFNDAKAEASALAAAAGRQLGPVLSMSTTPLGGPVAYARVAGGMAMEAAGAPGVDRDVVVTYQVQVRWAIAP
ncbi:MAG: SIMPL domain-containing protein [Gemmatimonadaceae bacterium]|nr:SIMPL domain-containing protein [Gemmatimonadaceae bacterium]